MLGTLRGRRFSGILGYGGKYDQNTLHKILKKLINIRNKILNLEPNQVRDGGTHL